MEIKFTAFTVSAFLLFAVATARNAVDPSTIPSTAWNDEAFKLIKTSLESVAVSDSDIVLPVEKPKSDSDKATADDLLPEPEKTANDIMPRTDFARFHTINRHFLGKPQDPNRIVTHRRPCHKSVTAVRTSTSEGNDAISSGRSNPELYRSQVPSNWLNVKHRYGSRRHHNHRRSDDGVKTKHMFDKEKLKSLIRQHKQKKREEEAGLMKSIRKFLKHTFD